MNNLNEKNKKIIKICIVICIFILIISTIIILAIRYNIEGDKNIPFQITSLRVISTAQGDKSEDNIWDLNIIQKNDLLFFIEKNPDYSKEDSISNITFNNFKFEKSPTKGTTNIYKPSTSTTLYNYTDEYKVNNELSYTGALSTNIPSLEISNQGGLIGFSIALTNLGNYLTDETSEITHDGTLLSNLNLTQEDISMKVSFDVIIETSKKNKFKTTINIDLPTGNIIQEGMSILDKTNFDDITYKRF